MLVAHFILGVILCIAVSWDHIDDTKYSCELLEHHLHLMLWQKQMHFCTHPLIILHAQVNVSIEAPLAWCRHGPISLWSILIDIRTSTKELLSLSEGIRQAIGWSLMDVKRNHSTGGICLLSRVREHINCKSVDCIEGCSCSHVPVKN